MKLLLKLAFDSNFLDVLLTHLNWKENIQETSRIYNRSIPSCFEPHYESEAKCKVFIMKIHVQTFMW